jgi:hypothetical protein
VPYLVVYLKDPKDCGSLKKPTDYAARFLRWQKGEWIELSQAEFPVDKALRNLRISFWGYTSKEDPKGTLDKWEDKARDESFPDRPETVKQYFERKRAYCARSAG